MTTQQANRRLRDTLALLLAAKQEMPSDAVVSEANRALDDFDDDLDRCISKVAAAVEIVSFEDLAADVARAEAVIGRAAA